MKYRLVRTWNPALDEAPEVPLEEWVVELQRDEGRLKPNQRILGAEELPLEHLADLIDHDAQDHGYFETVGSHRALAAILHGFVGRDNAGLILFDIATFGGLHRLSVVDDDLRWSTLEALGVPKPWGEWKLED